MSAGDIAYVVLLHECIRSPWPNAHLTQAVGSVAFEDAAAAEEFARWCHIQWQMDVSLCEVVGGTGEITSEWELVY